MKTLTFKPEVTVRVEADEGEIDVYVNGDRILVSPFGSFLETRYPGLAAAIEELRKPLGENEAWTGNKRWLISLHDTQSVVMTHGIEPVLIHSIDHVRKMADHLPDPEGWPRVLAIAERLLAERETKRQTIIESCSKIEVRWEQGMATVYVNGSRWGMFSHENQTHGKIDDRYPGVWEKHVLPCILANRPLAENEYRDSCSMIWQFEARVEESGRMIWQSESRVEEFGGMPKARVRYVTDDGSFGQWCSRDRRDLLVDPVWAAAFDYADRKFPRAGRQPAPQKPSEWIRAKAVDYSNGASQVAYTRRLTNAVIEYLDKLAAEAEAERLK